MPPSFLFSLSVIILAETWNDPSVSHLNRPYSKSNHNTGRLPKLRHAEKAADYTTVKPETAGQWTSNTCVDAPNLKTSSASEADGELGRGAGVGVKSWTRQT